MLAAIAVLVLGAIMTAIGIIDSAMYDIGLMTVFLGLVGVAVRSTELITSLLRTWRGG